ncbi:MAG: malate/lactate/ureidoglycolate dehydrogenase [Alphaproteobacteria bacterium]|nr:malate/lactate/ureidoglycolate dehydrogenase [Alphaproteobacteria bacterium]
MSVVVHAQRLGELIEAIFLKAGSAKAEAAAIAENLVTANLMGHDSHGVGLTPLYIQNVLGDRLTVNGHVHIVADNGAFLLLDGNMAYGQVVGREAMELGIAKARQHRVAVVGLRNVHHLGRIGAWAEQCSAAGFVSIHYVNAGGHEPLVAPFGGSDARFSTNPYATALPATAGPPIVLDMATSTVAMGKVRLAHNEGRDMKPGCLIDAMGNASTDPGVMYREPKGALVSMGEHKGYALAVICELLSAAFTGGGPAPRHAELKTIRNNMLSIIIDPMGFGVDTDFARDIDAFAAWVKASPVAPWAEAVMLPGDPERLRRAERERSGIPIDDQTWADILAAAHDVGLDTAGYLERA